MIQASYAIVPDFFNSLLGNFDAKAPPPKTQAFWEIVGASRAPEDAEMADAISVLGNPYALTLEDIRLRGRVSPEYAVWLADKANARRIPHRLESCGYVSVWNTDRPADGLFKINDRRQVIYARAELPEKERIAAARRCCGLSF